MTREEIKARMEEREEFIVDILKEDPKHTVSGKSIEDACRITAGNRATYMRSLMKKYPQIQNVGKKEAEYKWVECEKSAPKKNHEGYPDPTPKKAIDALSKDPSLCPGEVWSAIESNGASQLIFVLNSLNGAAQCIKLYHENTESIKITGPDYFQITIYGISYIGDPTHVTFKPLRYMSKRISTANEEKLHEARWFIARVFGIDIPKEEPALDEEKERLKEEVTNLRAKLQELIDRVAESKALEEPEQIPDNYIDWKTAQIAILTEQRDIWQAVAMKLLEKGGC